MEYRQIEPPLHLRPFVRHFAILRQDDTVSKAFKTVVDGCPGLIFQERPDSFLHRGEQPLPAQRVAVLIQFITRQVIRHDAFAKTALALTDIRSVTGMQRTLQRSERSLERLFKSYIGVTPALFHRINRFQSALDHLRGVHFRSLTDVAYEHDYADQSHYIREFKEFAGVSPKKYLSQAHEQARNFPEWRE